MDLITKFAPKIYLHPCDKHRPDSVEHYFNTVHLKQAGATLESQVTVEILQSHTGNDAYLEFANGQSPTGTNNFRTGAGIQRGIPPHTGTAAAPVYVKSFCYDTHFDIKYMFFYACQGFQTFQLQGWNLDSTCNFEWSPLARHQADWEHITVRLDPAGNTLLGAYYSQHSGSQWVEAPRLEDGTHPVVFSALNSHACYPHAGTFRLGTVLDLPRPGEARVCRLSAVDTTVVDDLVTYDLSDRRFDQVARVPYTQPGQLINLDVDDSENHTPGPAGWLRFGGCWGPPALDNTQIEHPPALPNGAEDFLFNWAIQEKAQLPKPMLWGHGPRSPLHQNWWNHKEP